MTRRQFFGSLGKLAALVACLPLLPFVPRESRLELIKRLMRNAINTHDDYIERCIFTGENL